MTDSDETDHCEEIEQDQEADDAMADLLGVEILPSVILPDGAQANTAPETNRGTPPPPEAFQRNRPQEQQGDCTANAAGHEHAAALVPTETSLEGGETLSAGAQPDEQGLITLEASIIALPMPWMRAFVLALYETGDPVAARRAIKPRYGTVLPGTLTKWQRECPAFGLLCQEHAQAQHEIVYASVFKGATEGHEIPLVSQGQVIGHYNRPCVKSAELHLKAHGLMPDSKATVTHTGAVAMVRDEDLPARLAELYRLMHPEPKAIEGTVVDEAK